MGNTAQYLIYTRFLSSYRMQYLCQLKTRSNVGVCVWCALYKSSEWIFVITRCITFSPEVIMLSSPTMNSNKTYWSVCVCYHINNDLRDDRDDFT